MKKMLTILMLASMFGAGAAVSASNTTDVTPTPKGRWICHVDAKTGQLICKCIRCSGW